MENVGKNKFQVQGRTKVINGSVLAPETAGLRFVLNIANLAGKQESPLYPLFEKKWKKVREEVRGWYVTKTGAYKFGAVLNNPVQSDTWVVSMLCQDDKLNTNLKGLEDCMKNVCKSAKYEKASVHISSLLTDVIPELAGLAQTELVENGVSVYFYDEGSSK